MKTLKITLVNGSVEFFHMSDADAKKTVEAIHNVTAKFFNIQGHLIRPELIASMVIL